MNNRNPLQFIRSSRWLIGLILIIGVLGVIILMQSQEKSNMSSQVELELQRVRSLLAPERVNKTLEETDPNPSPESIGAEAGIGFTVTELHFTFSVYVFNDWDGSNDAADELEARHDDDDSVYALAGTNGVLTFYGVVPQDVDNALELRFALADMVSAFSGDE